MNILLFALIVIIIAALVAYAISHLPLPSPYGGIAQCLVLLIAAYAIANRAGII